MEAARGLTFTLGPVEQIPLGEGRVFEVDGRSIAVFRTRQGEVVSDFPAGVSLNLASSLS